MSATVSDGRAPAPAPANEPTHTVRAPCPTGHGHLPSTPPAVHPDPESARTAGGATGEGATASTTAQCPHGTAPLPGGHAHPTGLPTSARMPQPLQVTLLPSGTSTGIQPGSHLAPAAGGQPLGGDGSSVDGGSGRGMDRCAGPQLPPGVRAMGAVAPLQGSTPEAGPALPPNPPSRATPNEQPLSHAEAVSAAAASAPASASVPQNGGATETERAATAKVQQVYHAIARLLRADTPSATHLAELDATGRRILRAVLSQQLAYAASVDPAVGQSIARSAAELCATQTADAVATGVNPLLIPSGLLDLRRVHARTRTNPAPPPPI